MKIQPDQKVHDFLLCAALIFIALPLIVSTLSSKELFVKDLSSLCMDYSSHYDFDARLISVTIMIFTILVFPPNLNK